MNPVDTISLYDSHAGCSRFCTAAMRVGLLLFAVLWLDSALATAEQSTGVDPETKLKSWYVKRGPFDLELSQRLPDQTRAFFLARGFDSKAADFIARQCVFKTVLKNTSTNAKPAVINIDMHEWKTQQRATVAGLRLREYWEKEFVAVYKPAKASALALYWAIYPTKNNLLPGDYNWGMTSYGLAPGLVFDLTVQWRDAEQVQTVIIRGIECAPDKRSL